MARRRPSSVSANVAPFTRAKLIATTGTVPCSPRISGSAHTSSPPKSSSPRPANSRERKQRTVSRLRVLPKRLGRQTRVTESRARHQSLTNPVLST